MKPGATVDQSHAENDIRELIGRGRINATSVMTIFPEFDTGSYGSEIHEMSEMAAVNFGQYAHSNQPSHHILYVFTVAGRQDRTAYWARKVMDDQR